MEEKNIIYGAGVYGQSLLHFLSGLGVQVDCFCQTKLSSDNLVDGLSVISFANLCKMEGKKRIFIAIRDKTASRKIKLWLKAVFMENALVVECGPFLDENNIHNCKSKCYCVLCCKEVKNFIGGGGADVKDIKLFQEHHIIGGGYRDNYKCPVCGSVDRERWQFLVLTKYTGIFRDKCRVLHFAPEPHLSEYIAANPGCDYYTGDIELGRAMHQTDILDIQYRDSVFDYVIMNHVLEHIENMKQAMSEVKRVLKPDGKLILSFPICADMDTFEMNEPLTKKQRLEYYGQEDHVRLFGRDYVQRIESLGFKVSVYTPCELLNEADVRRNGLLKDDVLMICNKR
ncbi:class I SAM-dependent methyltransferase [Selenomonas sp. KH1T6]|uniref:class I SAM-dependent methyltransferase n=1 Tax=Selenomonas sp. KH1T6 TaxID=3158784 RepID=UPI0008A769A1|nr:Methyltransferase domain-containing protein [Selenomonas ruminantium]